MSGRGAFGVCAMAASLIAAGLALAQSQTSTDPQTSTVSQKSETESPLVRAARDAKSKRKTHPKVITNKDVKSSKGKISVNTPPPLPPGSTPKAQTDPRSPLEKQDAEYKAHKAGEERVATDEKKVSELEKDLAAIEQAYYEEKDLNRRDTVIQKRFAQVKRQLEDARKELADARDALKAATP